ncbi:MAG: MBL fold metallo-hydrolase, partial [Candidatus Brockarchaeota archaeon]|nr:MBL fold metallo-hydrolase [Candidatus Brockarchaeota archaeon]
AAETFGVRSMATFVSTENVRILLDPGAALGFRFGLFPHPLEYSTLEISRKNLREISEKSDIIVITHYHYDHYTPPFERKDNLWTWSDKNESEVIFKDKVVIVKDVENYINYSQKVRGWYFQKFLKKIAKKVITGDNKEIKLEGVLMKIIGCIPHGEENSELGYLNIVEVVVDEEKFIFSPDIQGPISSKTLKTIIDEKPQIIYLGGPPTYLSGFSVNEEDILKGIENMKVVAKNVKKVIIDHHLIRDKEWKNIIEKVATESKNGEVFTAATYVKKPVRPFESIRKDLYERYPISEEFKKWLKKSNEYKRNNPPPLD